MTTFLRSKFTKRFLITATLCLLLLIGSRSFAQTINTYASSNTWGLGSSYIDVHADGLGNVYIGDSPNGRVIKVNSSGVANLSFITGLNTGSGMFLATDPSGNVYVSSYDDGAIYKYNSSGTLVGGFSCSIGSAYGIVYDPTSSSLYCSVWNTDIYKVNPTTGVNALFVSSGSFDYPWGMAVDGSGNLYLANGFGGTDKVLKITPAKVVTTFAGLGTSGNAGDGNVATNSRLNQPTGVTVDAAGNVYIADQLNHIIRRVDASTSIISTFAGINDYLTTFPNTPGNGPDGGLPTAARLNQPYAISYDPSNGNYYIADVNNGRIRVISPPCTAPPTPGNPSGTTSRCAAGGAGTYTISAVAGAASYTWTITGSGNTISGTSTTGTVTWNSAFSGTATVSVTATSACSLTSSAGSTAIVVNPPPTSSVINTYASSNTWGLGSSYIDVHADGLGNVYIGDSPNGRVIKVNSSGVANLSFITGLNTGSGMFLATDPSGNVYVSSYDDGKIYKYNSSGTIVGGFSCSIGSAYGIVYDPTSSSLYCSVWNTDVYKVNPTTGANALFVSSASFDYPWGMAVDGSGNLYLANGFGGTDKVLKITPAKVVTTFAGLGTSGNAGDGNVATNSRLNQPTGVTVDAAGNVYIADQLNHIIRRVDASTNIISTFAGINDYLTTFPNTPGNGPDGGLPTAARLNQPYAISYDPSNGNYYIADVNNGRIRVISPAPSAPVKPSGATSRCQGVGTNTYTTSAVTGATSYTWSVTGSGNTASGTGLTGTVSWGSGFSGTATVTVVANATCPSASSSPSSTGLAVSVAGTLPLPSAPSSVSTPCQGGTTVYTTSSAGATSYAWSVTGAGNSVSGTGTSGTVTWGSGFSGAATVSVIASNGVCTTSSSPASVTVGTVPLPSAPSGTTTRCFGASTSVYTTTAAGATSYSWAVTGAGNTVSGTGSSVTVTWGSSFAGNATVSVTATNSCGTSSPASTTVFTGGLSGTYTINSGVSGAPNLYPNTSTFNSFSSAITSLTNCGLAGPVTFNVIAGTNYNENPLFISFSSNPPNVTNTLTFVKSGGGANPVINVTGTAGGDAGILLNGVSYTTIDGLTISDAGTSQSNYIESGIILARATRDLGCQHDVIRNCRISMNINNDWTTNAVFNNSAFGPDPAPSNFYTTIGIYQVDCAGTQVVGGFDYYPTSAAGTHSFNSFDNNTIVNAGVGIALNGNSGYYSVPAGYHFFDGNNNIGVNGGNTITAGTSNAGGEAYGINISDQTAVRVANNTISAADNSTDWVYGIEIADFTIIATNVEEIDHNQVTISSSGGTSETFGIRAATGTVSSISVHDNTISNCNVSGTNLPLISLGSSAATLNVYGNTIKNNTGTSGIVGIETGGSTTVNVYNNQVFSNTASAGSLTGINIGGGTTTNTHDNQLFSNSAANGVTGINLASNSGACNVYNNSVHTLQTTAGGHNTYGIAAGTNLAAITATTPAIYNNFVSDLTAVQGIFGISISTNTTAKLFFNSVYLNQATAIQSTGIYNGNTTLGTAADVRNNLVINTSNPGASANTVALMLAGSAPFSGYASTSDYNNYYAGTPGAHNFVFYNSAGVNDQTLATFKTRLTSRDAHSITVNPVFTSVTDLHKTNMTYPGYLYLIAGQPVATYTTDIDGDTRNATTPDIGADEFIACEPSLAGTISGTASVCQNDNAVSYSVPSIAGATGYNWILPNGAFIEAGTNTNTISVFYSPSASSGTVTVNGTDGCGSGLSSSFAVTVKTTPPLVVTPNNAVCTGTTSASLVAGGASTYTWSPTANLTPSAGTSATETAQISQLTFYTVTGTGANSCTANVIVPVATVPIGGLISPSYSIICTNGSKTLTVTGAAGNNYQWQISSDNSIWTNITGATNTTYTTTGGDGTTNKFYRLMALSNSCWNVASTTAEVDISNPTIAISATNITDNSLTLNWGPTGTGNYAISYSGTSSATQTSVTPAKTITGLTAGGNYSVTVTQTGVAGCSASGTLTGVNTLCAMPTGVTLSSPANAQILVSWTGVGGANYRVYYRPLFAYGYFFTKDVSGISSALITKQGNNNLYGNTTYEVYVSRLDCPSAGLTGQPTNPTNVTTLPTLSCSTPVIDSVRSLCPVQIEVFIHPGSSPTNTYNVYLQRLTPTILAVNSYGITGNYFTINTPYAGDEYLIAVDSKCSGGVLSALYVWPGNVTVKPICNSPSNLVLSNPTCHGFTASWNGDACLSNPASGYSLSLRTVGTINYNSYGVAVPANGIGPNKPINWLTSGRNYQVFVRSVYSCNGFITYGPSSLTQTIATLSGGCREDEDVQPQADKPAVQQYSADNQEIFSLYPNPNNGEFTVDLSRFSPEEETVRIEVINMMGQTVMTHLTTISGGHMNEYINLPAGTSAGNYIVRLTAGKNVYTSKINLSK